jgi:hypothetical protein
MWAHTPCQHLCIIHTCDAHAHGSAPVTWVTPTPTHPASRLASRGCRDGPCYKAMLHGAWTTSPPTTRRLHAAGATQHNGSTRLNHPPAQLASLPHRALLAAEWWAHLLGKAMSHHRGV